MAEGAGTNHDPSLGEQARTAAKDARSSAQEFADAAREKAYEFADSARRQAHDYGEQSKNYAASETNKVAEALRRASQDLSEGSPQERFVGRLAEGLAEGADHLRGKDVSELGQELTSFARRNPAMFLGGAALLGFAASRFLKSSAEGHEPEAPRYPAPAPASAGGPAPMPVPPSAKTGPETGSV